MAPKHHRRRINKQGTHKCVPCGWNCCACIYLRCFATLHADQRREQEQRLTQAAVGQ